MGETRNAWAYKTLFAKPEEKMPLGRSRRRWEDNIKMALREIACDCVDWTYLAQDRERDGELL
jgi:hypothetical protein